MITTASRPGPMRQFRISTKGARVNGRGPETPTVQPRADRRCLDRCARGLICSSINSPLCRAFCQGAACICVWERRLRWHAGLLPPADPSLPLSYLRRQGRQRMKDGCASLSVSAGRPSHPYGGNDEGIRLAARMVEDCRQRPDAATRDMGGAGSADRSAPTRCKARCKPGAV